jgi:hypothetical protein
MARVVVPRRDFENGRLAPVCAKTGLPATQHVSLRGWRVRGTVPMSDKAYRRLHRIPARRAATLGAGLVALWVLSIAAHGLRVVPASIVGGAFVVLALVDLGWTPRARLRGRDAVMLTHVHPKAGRAWSRRVSR